MSTLEFLTKKEDGRGSGSLWRYPLKNQVCWYFEKLSYEYIHVTKIRINHQLFYLRRTSLTFMLEQEIKKRDRKEGKQRKEEAMVKFVFGNGRVTRIRYTVDTPIIGTLKAQ